MSLPRSVVLSVPCSTEILLTMQTVVRATAYAIANRRLSFYSVGYSHLDSETSYALLCSPECPSLHAYTMKCLYHYQLCYPF